MKNATLKDLGLAVLRIGSSVLLMTHGFPKFQQLISGDFEFGNPLGIGATPTLFLAVLAEFIAPILIIIGYRTRWVALFPIITMAVAAFMVHAQDALGVKEKALLFLVAFVTIGLVGPGKYSLDRK